MPRLSSRLSLALTAVAGLVLGVAVAQLGPGHAAPTDDQLRTEYAPVLALKGTAKQEILAIARLLARQPGMAIDFSKAPSRQYCLAPGAGSMVHFAIEPGRAPVDIVYFHEAEPLLAKGLDAATLPPEPATIAGMKPGVWYYNDGSRPEPFHGQPMGQKLLVFGVAVR
jgi:hypothetical protein